MTKLLSSLYGKIQTCLVLLAMCQVGQATRHTVNETLGVYCAQRPAERHLEGTEVEVKMHFSVSVILGQKY